VTNTITPPPARGQSNLQRISRFLKKPASERQKLVKIHTQAFLARVFLFKPIFLNLSLAYQPDSHATFNAHPEFDELFRSFIKHNKLNNSGDIPRLWSFILNVEQIIEENVKGDFAELGVWRGNTASVLAHIASKNNRRVFLFDTFEGFNCNDIKGVDSDKDVTSFSDTSINLVRDVIGKHFECCNVVKGHFPLSLNESHKAERYAVVSLDCDLYEPMKEGLQFFYPRMPKGGILLLHDYSSKQWAGAKLAIDEFCKDSGEFIVLMPDKSGSAVLRKTK
jgi:hypothetical protein